MTTSEALAALPNIEADLRRANQELIGLEKIFRDSGGSVGKGAELIQARTDFADLASKYQFVRVSFGLQPASGLGLIPAAVWAGAVLVAKVGLIIAGIAALFSLLATIRQHYQAAQAQAVAAAAAEENRTILLAQAVAADNAATLAEMRGDTAEAQRLRLQAQQLRGQAGQPGAAGAADFGAWFQENWWMLAAAVAGIVVLPRLVD